MEQDEDENEGQNSCQVCGLAASYLGSLSCQDLCVGVFERGVNEGPQFCPLPEFVSAACAAAAAERPSGALRQGVQLSVGWVGISVVVMILVVGLAASKATQAQASPLAAGQQG